ncbi:MAG: 4Fe-4S binding protein [Anaerolineae bacterium]|nr:4Fe-4S binding protein [Anaerolineae bacterium]
MIKKRRDPSKLRRLRQIVQIVFLLVFAFLLVKALFGRVPGSWVPLLIMTLTTAILTLVLGRVWCGWVCPLGHSPLLDAFQGSHRTGSASVEPLADGQVRPAVPDPGSGAAGPCAPCGRLDGQEPGCERHRHHPCVGCQRGAESHHRPFLVPLSVSFGRGSGAVIEDRPHAPNRARSL